jgi:hypothetical protein
MDMVNTKPALTNTAAMPTTTTQQHQQPFQSQMSLQSMNMPLTLDSSNSNSHFNFSNASFIPQNNAMSNNATTPTIGNQSMQQQHMLLQRAQSYQQQPHAGHQQQQLHSKLSTSHKASKSVIHVRENSMEELEALFDKNKWPTNRSGKATPLSKRNLPQSFFRPPERGTKTPNSNNSRQSSLTNSAQHSRQSSTDQQFLLAQQQQNQLLLQQKLNNLNGSGGGGGLFAGLNNHSRSASEPVVMAPFTNGLIQQQQQQPTQATPMQQSQQAYTNHHQQLEIPQQQQHFMHLSMSSGNQLHLKQSSLPYGWDQQQQQQQMPISNIAQPLSAGNNSQRPYLAKYDRLCIDVYL